MREKLDSLRPVAIPTVLGAAATVAIGLLGGGWRSGVYVGGSVAGFYGLFEYLHARGGELRRRHGGR